MKWETRIENGIFNERVLRIAMIECAALDERKIFIEENWRVRSPEQAEVREIPSSEIPFDAGQRYTHNTDDDIESFRANPSGVTLSAALKIDEFFSLEMPQPLHLSASLWYIDFSLVWKETVEMEWKTKITRY